MFTITIMVAKRKPKAEKTLQLTGELKTNNLAQVPWLLPSRESPCDLCPLHFLSICFGQKKINNTSNLNESFCVMGENRYLMLKYYHIQ